MKLRKEIIRQKVVKHKNLMFVKKNNNNNNPIWKLFPGKKGGENKPRKNGDVKNSRLWE